MLVKNAIKCKYCKQTIESVHRHDFNVCGCGKVGIDGGILDYIRVMGEIGSYEDKSIYSNDFEIQRKHIKWGKNYDKNMKRLPETKWIPIYKLKTDHIEAILKNVKTIDPIYKKLLKKELKYRKDNV